MPKRRVRVLVVDDDAVAAESLAEFLREDGYEVATALEGHSALRLLSEATERSPSEERQAFSVLITDQSMPGMSGLELVREVRSKHPAVSVLVLTGYGTIDSAVEAVRTGAIDYLTKPVVDVELRLALERALSEHGLRAENTRLKARLEDRYGLDRIVGTDPRMLRIFELVEAVAPSKTTVLMNGESGTGKSLIAQAIHQMSPRKDGPFVQLSCGSIPETLLESELFGHVRGAFTGAHADKIGRFLAADGGTIFLDEINSASPGMQLKLLRVLQERKFEPVGSSETVEVDVRVVLATNKPLEGLVASGEFRQDLYYRINVVTIDLPPLRERVSDIALLAGHFLQRHSEAIGREFLGFSPEAMEALERYPFPGNVRELENIVERATVLARSPTISVAELPKHVLDPASNPMMPQEIRDRYGLPNRTDGQFGQTGSCADATAVSWVPTSLEDALREPERRILLKALEANGWNRQKTADDLRINRTTLYKKMKQLGIEEQRLAG